MRCRFNRRPFLPLLLALTVFPACAARKPGELPQPARLNFFSPEQDIELGREAAAQLRRELSIVQDQTLQAYIDRLGRKLASQSAAGKYPYEFTLVNDNSINAFALPGGPVFVNSGLITAADNEGQLAGVIGHEIGHVALRHGTSQASKGQLISLPAILAGSLIGSGSILGQLAQAGIGLGAQSVLLNYSRGAENEADVLGTHIMHDAGYNPIEAARFFEKLQAEGGSRAPQFLSSHPDPGNRVKNVQAEIRQLSAREYQAANMSEFQSMKQRVQKLPAPAQQRRSAEVHDPPQASAPVVSSRFRQLRRNSYAISHPDNWEVFEDSPGTVTIAPKQGLVQAGDGVQVAYGTILGHYAPKSRGDLRQATGELVQSLRAGNPAMRVQSEPSQSRVNGRAALVTNLSNASPYRGVTERDVVVTVARPEGVFYMIFIAPQNDFANLESVFQSMIRSVRFRN
ncbi:MAG: M48 family metallopeptidase [Bryobacteraceae bacterium]